MNSSDSENEYFTEYYYSTDNDSDDSDEEDTVYDLTLPVLSNKGEDTGSTHTFKSLSRNDRRMIKYVAGMKPEVVKYPYNGVNKSIHTNYCQAAKTKAGLCRAIIGQSDSMGKRNNVFSVGNSKKQYDQTND